MATDICARRPGSRAARPFDETCLAVRIDYQPRELIESPRRRAAAAPTGMEPWRVRSPLAPQSKDSSDYNARRYEEMVRQVMSGRASRRDSHADPHLYSKDPDGTSAKCRPDEPIPCSRNTDETSAAPLTSFQQRNQFEKMEEVVIPLVFAVDDGTIHGTWGVGQMPSSVVEHEKSFNDWIASNKMVAKIKAQTESGKNADEVRLKVEDYLMIPQGATFAGNTAAVTTDPAVPYCAGFALAAKARSVNPFRQY
jgi:hypothetical protein